MSSLAKRVKLISTDRKVIFRQLGNREKQQSFETSLMFVQECS